MKFGDLLRLPPAVWVAFVVMLWPAIWAAVATVMALVTDILHLTRPHGTLPAGKSAVVRG